MMQHSMLLKRRRPDVQPLEVRRLLRHDFADGGAEDERTRCRNESAFDNYWLVPKPMNGASKRDLSVKFLGHTYSIPVMIGPTGLSGLFWPGGELATARAAARGR